MIKKHCLILLGVIVLAAFLRLWQLPDLPPALEWDEVATGYDAHSILKTGKDQYGHFLPLTIRSLDDYKPPLYTYLTAASISIWGWNDWAVRFPAALLGTLAVLTCYLMVWEMFHSRKLALLASLLLCISPWHVHFSRLALETNSTIFFTTLGIWAFLKGTKNGKYLIVTAVAFGLDLYLYHNTRVFIPLLCVALLLIYFRQLWIQKKYLFVSIIIFSLFVIRLIPILFSVEGQMRFQGTSIFSIDRTIDIDNLQKQYMTWKSIDRQAGLNIIGKIFHSEKVLFGLQMMRNYLSHFDPNFWVSTNDNPRHHISEMGLLYLIELPLVYLGLYFLTKKDRQTAGLILVWMLLTPIPASVTRDAPHALRVTIFLPMFQILISLAILQTINIFQGKLPRLSARALVVLLYFLSFTFFMHQYFVHYAQDTSRYWIYGMEQAAVYAQSVKDKYDRIVINPHNNLEQAYIFFLYYLKYDPVKYLQEGGTVSGGWAEQRNGFDKYEFKSFDYSSEKDGKTLFIGSPTVFPSGLSTREKIDFLDGTEAIWIVD